MIALLYSLELLLWAPALRDAEIHVEHLERRGIPALYLKCSAAHMAALQSALLVHLGKSPKANSYIKSLMVFPENLRNETLS